jgi:hypothetical protein
MSIQSRGQMKLWDFGPSRLTLLADCWRLDALIAELSYELLRHTRLCSIAFGIHSSTTSRFRVMHRSTGHFAVTIIKASFSGEHIRYRLSQIFFSVHYHAFEEVYHLMKSRTPEHRVQLFCGRSKRSRLYYYDGGIYEHIMMSSKIQRKQVLIKRRPKKPIGSFSRVDARMERIVMTKLPVKRSSLCRRWGRHKADPRQSGK